MSHTTRILCIDDEPGVVELVSLILKAPDVEVEGANSGSAALEIMRQSPPDVVLLDIMMPEMDGWEVYKEMQADDSLRQIPVIIVTGSKPPTQTV